MLWFEDGMKWTQLLLYKNLCTRQREKRVFLHLDNLKLRELAVNFRPKVK